MVPYAHPRFNVFILLVYLEVPEKVRKVETGVNGWQKIMLNMKGLIMQRLGAWGQGRVSKTEEAR